jgi:hypothetical protein
MPEGKAQRVGANGGNGKEQQDNPADQTDQAVCRLSSERASA